MSSDFCGLARRRRQEDEPGCTHIYFTGCAGNIAAGKYNDGTPAARATLTRRIYDGIVASEAKLQREPIERLEVADPTNCADGEPRPRDRMHSRSS